MSVVEDYKKAGIPVLSIKKVYILWKIFLGLIAFRFDQAINFLPSGTYGVYIITLYRNLRSQ